MTKFAVAFAGLLIVAVGVTMWVQSEPVVELADQLLEENNYTRAQKILKGHLEDNPDDTRALQLLSEAMQMDPKITGIRGTEQILAVLDKIPDTAPEGLVTRLQQAELSIKMLHEVQRAEGYARRAIALNPKDRRGSQLLLSLFQLTRRFPVGEKYYDLIYENTPPDLRIDVMKNWYISQFDPFAINKPFDESLNLDQNAETEMYRYGTFMQLEPSAPAPRAAIASRYLDEGTAKEAVALMMEDVIDRSKADEFFVYQLTRGLVYLGRLDEAEKEFEAWSFEKDGHLYHRLAALMAEQNEGDYKKALDHYDKASRFWPSPVDQQFQALHVSAMRKARNAEAAEELDKKIKAQLAWALNPRVHLTLNEAIKKLPDPKAVQAFASFYAGLGREKDSKRWLATLDAKEEIVQPSIQDGF